jgi:hypothetical protein
MYGELTMIVVSTTAGARHRSGVRQVTERHWTSQGPDHRAQHGAVGMFSDAMRRKATRSSCYRASSSRVMMRLKPAW